jgi:hypothetical protein
MATVAGAHSSYSEPIATGGNKEDLSDLIHDVSPTDTPGMAAMKKMKATGTAHDYLTDELEDAADNAHVEGEDAAPAAAASRIRMSNYTQIFKKHAVVSGTQEKVLKGGGIKSEMAYQVGRRMKAIKRDVERAIFGVNNVKVAGNTTTTAREMGSLSSYLGDSEGLGGDSYAGNGTSTTPTGDGTDVSDGAGADRAFSEVILTDALGTLWDQSGGNENIIALVGKFNRGKFSSFTASSTRYVTTDDKKLVASIDVYDGDFHTVTAAPDRYSLAGNVFLLDPEFIGLADLRPLHSYDLAKTGDSFRKELVWETTLEVCNPRAHINIADLTSA